MNRIDWSSFSYCPDNPHLSKDFLKLTFAVVVIGSIGLVIASYMGQIPPPLGYGIGGGVFAFCVGLGLSKLYEHCSAKKNVKMEKDLGARSQALLASFYTGNGKDIEGRTFEEILGWGDDQLESVHNYIQWLFPIFRPSTGSSNVLQLTQPILRELKSSNTAKEKLQKAFGRMMTFYGLQYNSEEKEVSQISWEKVKSKWTEDGFSHNHLRITRILTCLMHMGFSDQARAFLEQLSQIYRKKSKELNISKETLEDYWEKAVSDPDKGCIPRS